MSTYVKFIDELTVNEIKICLSSVGCTSFKGKKGTLLKRLIDILENQGVETSNVIVKFTKDRELKAQLICDGVDSHGLEGDEESEGNRGATSNGVSDDGKLPHLAVEVTSKERERQLEMEIDVLRSQISKLLQQKDGLDSGQDCNASEDKPKYSMVSVLSMDDLKGIAAHGKLNNWCKEVELFCGKADSTRVKGAFARMDQFIKSAVVSCNSLSLTSCSWEQMKTHLKAVLLPKQTFHTAWLELTSKRYDSSQPPREYFIEIMNLHASISQVFHEVPDLHSTVRQLMARDFPKEISDYMSSFLDSKVSFERFLEELEIHWGSLAKPVHTQAYVRKIEAIDDKTLVSDSCKTKKKENVKFNKRKWCHICYASSHFTDNCLNKPPPGTCWACKKEGHVMKNCPDYQFFRGQSKKVCRDMYLKLGSR